MPDYQDADKTELFSIPDQEQYLVHSRLEIVRVLQELSKRPDIITAYFNHGKEYALTAVLGVLTERDLLVLDYGADEKLNQRLMAADRITCVTKHDNIDVRFTVTGVQRAKFQNQPAFAALLPESVYRLQRREFFRVSTPIVNPLIVRIPQGNADPIELPMADISVGGVGLHDCELSFDAEPLTRLEGCGIELPGFGFVKVDLEVRNVSLQPLNDGSQVRRIGCAFLDMPLDVSARIQRYIHRLQIEQKATSGRD
jgi:c-di-GMP-binding flagellar brake protein YcgR